MLGYSTLGMDGAWMMLYSNDVKFYYIEYYSLTIKLG